MCVLSVVHVQRSLGSTCCLVCEIVSSCILSIFGFSVMIVSHTFFFFLVMNGVVVLTLQLLEREVRKNSTYVVGTPPNCNSTSKLLRLGPGLFSRSTAAATVCGAAAFQSVHLVFTPQKGLSSLHILFDCSEGVAGTSYPPSCGLYSFTRILLFFYRDFFRFFFRLFRWKGRIFDKRGRDEKQRLVDIGAGIP